MQNSIIKYALDFPQWFQVVFLSPYPFCIRLQEQKAIKGTGFHLHPTVIQFCFLGDKNNLHEGFSYALNGFENK